MKVYETKNIRNIALFGHAGSGKTTFAESALFEAGALNRKGSVEEKNTASDFGELEHEKGSSVFAIPLIAEFKNTKLNIIDTPGFNDYLGEVVAGARIADTGFVFINAQNGIEVGAENGWEYCEKKNNPVVFVINKLDIEQAKFEKCEEDIKTAYGNSATIVQFPVNPGPGFNKIIDVLKMKMLEYDENGKVKENDISGSDAEKAESIRSELIESIAETDEDLMNKYFEEGSLTEEEINSGLRKAMLKRQIFPIFCASGKTGAGVSRMMEFAVNVCPPPNDKGPEVTVGEKEIACDPNAKVSIFVFKLMSEAQTGEIVFFKVMSGTLKTGMDLINDQKNTPERFNAIYVPNGKKRADVEEIHAGDIGAAVKLKSVLVNHTLHEKGFDVRFQDLQYPEPIARIAVVPQTKGEEEKIGMGINAIAHEDPSLRVEHSQELKQLIIHGLGEMHLGAVKWRLENRYKAPCEFIPPRIPYRETIQKQIRGSYRHKKQSGGAGQFAEVHMMIEPWHEGLADPTDMSVRGKDLHDLDWGGKLEFLNCIVGGVIDQRFMPAILKGVMEKMHIGPLTGSYVRDIRVAVYDGKMHPVDSNEAAFKMAGSMAFKDNFVQAAPKILEPIYDVKIKAPEEYVGDVMSDLPSRRGVIQGIEAVGKYQIISAKMPLAELDRYATAIRSMTAGRATYSQKYAEYQAVPPNVQQDLIDAYKKQEEED